jgi:uncharacterized delta-60 repeat protein
VNRVLGGSPFAITATASSGLPVTFAILGGPATIAGNIVTLTDAGTITIRATQEGDSNYNEAPPVDQSFTVMLPAGSIDPTFDPGRGSNDFVWPVVTQPDNKVIIGGNFTNYDGISRNRIARLNVDGSLDLTFDPHGGANALVLASVLQPDGKILISGSFNSFDGVSRSRIARLNQDGSLDSSFDPGAGATSAGSPFVFAIELQPDGKILIGGTFTAYDNTPRNHVARLNRNGSLDTSFDPGNAADLNVQALALQSDGRIIVGGSAIIRNGVIGPSVVRLNSTGSLDTSFAPTQPNGSLTSIALEPDGRVLIGGQFTKGVLRLNADGSPDNSFNANTSLVQTILRQVDGKVLVGGSFTTVNSTSRRAFARLNSDGSLDKTLDLGTGSKAGANNGQTFGLTLDRAGRIIVGGFFDIFNGLPRSNVLRLLPTVGASQFLPTDFSVGEWEGSANIVLNRTGGTDNRLFAKIALTDVTTSPQDYLLNKGSLDGTFNPGQGTNGTVLTSALQADGRLIVGGSFNTYKSASRNGLARVNPDGSLDNSFNPGRSCLGQSLATRRQASHRRCFHHLQRSIA